MATAAARKRKPRSKNAVSILVVDDEPMIRDMLKQYLGIQGFHVQSAKDGAEALAFVAQDPPQMIILDMYMPGMNGIEVLGELRARRYKGGVIALTASQDEKLLQEALKLGTVDILGKPVDLARLSLAIQVSLAFGA